VNSGVTVPALFWFQEFSGVTIPSSALPGSNRYESPPGPYLPTHSTKDLAVFKKLNQHPDLTESTLAELEIVAATSFRL